MPNFLSNNQTPIAIIGGGIASASLAAALVKRQQAVDLFCEDALPAQRASGNRQGALYPLLNPQDIELTNFFIECFHYSRAQFLELLSTSSFELPHEFCGVLQTAAADKHQAKFLNQFNYPWAKEVAYQVTPAQSSALAGVGIDRQGLFYPLAGWICPAKWTQAIFGELAKQTNLFQMQFNCQLTRIEQTEQGWLLHQQQEAGQVTTYGPYAKLVLANGLGLTQFEQSQYLQVSPFRGQVSHIPSQGKLSDLKTVLCDTGYLTPKWQGGHCMGATYVKNDTQTELRAHEGEANRKKITDAYPDQAWIADIDISAEQGRAGVRMVCRDHYPMMGQVPDLSPWLNLPKNFAPEKRQQQMQYFDGLYALGGFGSRGLCTAPLVAEALAGQLMGEQSPFATEIMDKLNPARMFIRRLQKNRPLF